MTGGGTSPWGRRGLLALCLPAPACSRRRSSCSSAPAGCPGRTAAIPLRGPVVLGTLMAALRAGFILFRRRRHVKDAAAARAAGLRHADHDAPYAARLEQPCGIRRARVSVRRVVERPDGTRSGEFLVRGGTGESIRCFADMALPVPAGPPVTCNALTGDRAFDEEWALMTTAPPRRRCSARSCAPSWAPTASAGCIWPTAV